MKNRKVLIADDQAEYLEYCAAALTSAGYEPILATSGEGALQMFHSHRPLIVCIDISMPDLSGIEVCRLIRAREQLPFIIFITGSTGSDNRIAGFEVGADDYPEKPFSLAELVARVNAGARRVGRNAVRQLFSFGPATIDPHEQRATIGDDVQPLTHREIELISYFSSHPNEPLSRDELYSACWPGNANYIGRTVDQHVLKVRKKLGRDVIGNIYGVGFLYRTSQSPHTRSAPPKAPAP